MEFFNFVETFFFISLAITFVLIMMLVYHFKERLSVLEKKTNTMFDIVNNIVQELNYIRNQSIPQRMESPTYIPLSNIFSQMGNKILVSEEETDDDTDDDSVEELQEQEQEESIKRINIDFSTKEEVDDIDLDELKEDSSDEELEQPEQPEPVESLMETYKKLDVSALRTLVASKGLTIDTKKMKKTDLLKLLETV
jgi:hypothetical protein